mmetsp:Transcript_12324/g.34542  ORF Transcript_12324/g.34542 Transcript_12324/m.34542 type:complete len:248 (+) Transcript_12324:220-963(+)
MCKQRSAKQQCLLRVGRTGASRGGGGGGRGGWRRELGWWPWQGPGIGYTALNVKQSRDRAGAASRLLRSTGGSQVFLDDRRGGVHLDLPSARVLLAQALRKPRVLASGLASRRVALRPVGHGHGWQAAQLLLPLLPVQLLLVYDLPPQVGRLGTRGLGRGSPGCPGRPCGIDQLRGRLRVAKALRARLPRGRGLLGLQRHDAGLELLAAPLPGPILVPERVHLDDELCVLGGEPAHLQFAAPLRLAL